MLKLLLFLSLLVGQAIQAQETARSLPKGYREVGPDKEAALRGEVCKATTETGLFSGAVLVAEGKKVIYKEAFGMANREWDILNSKDTKFNRAPEVLASENWLLPFELLASTAGKRADARPSLLSHRC